MNDSERRVHELCETIGYGAVMQIASQLWSNREDDGTHKVVGPCGALVVPCPEHTERCNWCEDCGWVTQKVHDLIVAVTTEPPEDDITKCPKCGGPADQGFDRCVPPSPYYCSKCDPPECHTCGHRPAEYYAKTREMLCIQCRIGREYKGCQLQGPGWARDCPCDHCKAYFEARDDG